MGSQTSQTNDISTQLNSTEYKSEIIENNTALRNECAHISECCDKDEALKILQTKLAILEIQTFSKIKFSRECGHPKCTKSAPESFPASDVFLCEEHLTQVSQHFGRNMKANSIQSQIELAHKKADTKGKQIIRNIFGAFTNVNDAFQNGSINSAAALPNNYWSLLMTKLLTTLNYLKISKKTNKNGIKLVESMIQLLLLHRFVMNPIGIATLIFIATVILVIIVIIKSFTYLVQVVKDMIQTITQSVLFGYAVQFVDAVRNMSGKAWAKSAIAVGSVMGANGAIVASTAVSAAVVPGIGLAVAGGILITVGVVYLVKNRQNNPQRVGGQVLNQFGNNITQLANNNNLTQLTQQLQALQVQQP